MTQKILVIEDELILIQALEAEFSGEGFEVFSATDGEKGLQIIKDEVVDLIVLDIILPKMNGFELLRILKKDSKKKTIPVIILSNLSQEGEISMGIELGASDFFVKSSTDLANLIGKVRSLLRKKDVKEE